MADTVADSITKAPAATNADEKAPSATETLPPVTKEPAATADASMVPSTAAETKADAALVAPSSGAAAKDVKETDDTALEAEKPKDPAPTPVHQPTESNGTSAEQPKPVSVEEIRDEALPEAKPSELEKSEKPAEVAVPKGDEPTETAPTTDAPSAETPAVDSASAPAPAPAPAKDDDAVVGEKRKAEEAATAEPVKDQSETGKGEDEPAEKKQKTNGTAANGPGRKPGRPKKETKKAPAPVGRTLRKTRSQGAADL
ncbi:hypothetical protein F5Y17DRAFT_241506 [Xylariaceae sp. FL0594]|nr:hypothetical protein F5Y17DRAFT_241506 [Xylariaceae sp. FL0594]